MMGSGLAQVRIRASPRMIPGIEYGTEMMPSHHPDQHRGTADHQIGHDGAQHHADQRSGDSKEDTILDGVKALGVAEHKGEVLQSHVVQAVASADAFHEGGHDQGQHGHEVDDENDQPHQALHQQLLRRRKNRGDMSSRSVCMVWNILATCHRIRDESTPITPRITDSAAASPKLFPEKEMMA